MIEKSAGAVIFRKEPRSRKSSLRGRGEKVLYLLLHYPAGSRTSKDYWDFPKGHIEKGEKDTETVRREVKEETGLEDIELVEGFKSGIRYFFRFEDKKILKFVTFYLAESKTKKVKISPEHIGYKWLPYEQALNQLTYENAKEILQKANDYLSKKSL